MIITKLILRDFGLYSGDHQFDLRPEDDANGPRPLILFGGKNGAGKTTILDALRLCLYGQQALGLRATAAEYQAHLSKRLHQSRLHTANSALVALEFEHPHQGELALFRIERAWRRTDREIEEHLELRKNGGPHFGMGPDHWPQLLKELVPIGLANLFFFDGEQIQRLADDEQGGPGLSAALKELLGLNLIEQLEADLRVYLTRLGTAPADSSREHLEDLYRQREHWRADQDARRQDLAALGTQLERLAHKAAEQEAHIASQGGVYADLRSAAESEKLTLAANVKQAVQELQEACAGLLPFALAPTIAQAVLRQLDDEERCEHQQATREVLREQAALLVFRMTDDIFWQPVADVIGDATRECIISQVHEALLAQAEPIGASATRQVVHGLSVQDRQRLRNWIDQASGQVCAQSANAAHELMEARVQLEQVEATLHAVPPTELLAPFLKDLSTLHSAMNKLRIERADVEERWKRAGIEIEQATRAIARIEALHQRRARQDQKGSLADRVLDILPDYRHRQLRRKIGDLESAFADRFNLLARKSEFLSHVVINISDFTMTLVSNDGRYIPKAQLSSGEKQIYAIALLWALRTVAGRPLPVVIDTPLGRLDSNHRQNLVERYFPNASHQVIILSTDTEIDASYFAELAPHISHAYLVVYDDATGTSHAEEGYFWQGAANQPEVVHAS